MLDTDWVLSHLPKYGRPFTKLECYASWVYDQFVGKKYTRREYAKLWMIPESNAGRLTKEFAKITANQKWTKTEPLEARNIKASQTGCETKVNQKRTNNKLIYIKEDNTYAHSALNLENQKTTATAPLAFADATAPAMPEGTAPCTSKPSRQDFEEAWKLYPKKLGKEKAYNHFKAQVLTLEDNASLLKAINNYNEYIKTLEEKYIKHGSTFFNKDWKDFVEYKKYDRIKQYDPNDFR